MVSADRSASLSFAEADGMGSLNAQARSVLSEMFAAAVGAADPAKVLAPRLPQRPLGRCVVVGAGKAAASMAAALEAAWADVELTGVVAVPYGYGVHCRRIRVREAGHPLPDANSTLAAEEILEAVAGLAPEDMVIALISGGGSAAMCLPLPGLSLEDKRITNRLLLGSGLDIRTMNAVRRRISAIKGGKLAAAASPAIVVTLAISDIPGDDPAAIASGPTMPDPTRDIDLSGVAASLGPELPPAVARLLAQPARPAVETVDHAADVRLIATPARALEAAAQVACSHGVVPVILGDDIEGESRSVAKKMALDIDRPTYPAVWLSGGETTVTLGTAAAGRGGRNTEFALSLACALNERANIWALAADTDGEDGANLGAAGAIVGPDTISRARCLGLDPLAYLDAHDSGGFFAALEDLVITGPTRTNVNDFRAILILPSEQR